MEVCEGERGLGLPVGGRGVVTYEARMQLWTLVGLDFHSVVHAD